MKIKTGFFLIEVILSAGLICVPAFALQNYPSALPQVYRQVWHIPLLLAAGAVLLAGGLFRLIRFRNTGRRVIISIAIPAAGVLLLAAGLFFLFEQNRENIFAKERSAEILSDTEKQIAPGRAEPFFSDVRMPVAATPNLDVSCILKIESLDLELPVAAYYTEEKIKDAPFCYYGSAYNDTLVIGAVNYPAFFGRLGELKKDDLVILTDVNGNSFRYRMLDSEKVASSHPELLFTSDSALTLFTGGGSNESILALRFEPMGTGPLVLPPDPRLPYLP